MAYTVNTSMEQSPLPKLVQSLGQAIAEAQLELDKNSIEIARRLQAPLEVFPGLPPRSMLELGFTPTFYHFTETTIKARVAFSSQYACFTAATVYTTASRKRRSDVC